jgi:phenylacetate-CoA ligase
MPESHRDATRRRWLATLEHYHRYADTAGSDAYWAPILDTASRDELMAIQNARLAALVPFLYENSSFYRRTRR